MATIRIKRTSTSNRPSSLANAELAMIEGSNTLVIGVGVGGESGSATSVIDVGGTGAFLGLSNSLTQTAAGNYTFTGGLTVTGTASLGAATATSPDANDDSTRVATTAWVQDEIAALGAGSVTSVGLSLPSIFTVTNSPVTSTGTLTATLASQSANVVFAGPSTGGNAAPSFRSLVAADIPDLSATYLSLTGTHTASGTYTFSGAVSLGSQATATTPLASDNSTAVATTAWVQGQAYLTSETYTGTVTSVGLSLPDLFSVTGSPVTASGTLSATLASQLQNRVFAAPSSGNGSPTFRTLVAGDLPAHSHAVSDVTGLQDALDAKANLASPALTGVPTAPTAAALTNSTQVATTAYVDVAVAAIVNSAPEALNTLNELSQALGNNANFATSISTSLGEKLAKASNLSDLADVATARSNLGLGSMAVQSANNVSITGGTIGGTTVIDGGSYT